MDMAQAWRVNWKTIGAVLVLWGIFTAESKAAVPLTTVTWGAVGALCLMAGLVIVFNHEIKQALT